MLLRIEHTSISSEEFKISETHTFRFQDTDTQSYRDLQISRFRNLDLEIFTPDTNIEVSIDWESLW